MVRGGRPKNFVIIFRMAKIWNKTEHTPATSGRGKKTSIGRRNVGFANMNKNKKSQFKAYRGQGR